ncbi:MAG: hypothetical protein ISN29_03550 [Gammaproteobacteria bacterium AqS3]|nr:hypothetical protein [Gammaproteobacteria bacterium AqS3]
MECYWCVMSQDSQTGKWGRCEDKAGMSKQAALSLRDFYRSLSSGQYIIAPLRFEVRAHCPGSFHDFETYPNERLGREALRGMFDRHPNATPMRVCLFEIFDPETPCLLGAMRRDEPGVIIHEAVGIPAAR